MSELSLEFPAKIQLQTINLCNYACGMCPYPDGAKGRVKQLLPESVFTSLLEQCRERATGVELCLMLQNEPLLDQRFRRWAERAHAMEGIRSVSTVTNGSLLDVTLLDALTALERFQLTISLNATNREAYRTVHGQDRWDQICELLGAWRGDRQRVLLSAVVSRDELDLGLRFRQQWEGQGYRTRLVPMNQRSGAKPLKRALHLLRPEVGHCHYPLDTLTVLADGRVVLCCQDWRHDTTFGDVQQTSIAEIWRNSALAAIRAASAAGRIRDVDGCQRCDYPMRSADRLQLEDAIVGQSSRVDRDFVVHPARLRGDAGVTAEVAVIAAKPDGRLEVATRAELPTGVAILLPLSYENGSVCEVACRAELTSSSELPRGLRRHSLTLDRSDPGFAFYDWYRRDWQQEPSVSEVHRA